MEPEIEITEAMVEARMEAAGKFYLGDGVTPITAEFLAAVFRAMIQAPQKSL